MVEIKVSTETLHRVLQQHGAAHSIGVNASDLCYYRDGTHMETLASISKQGVAYSFMLHSDRIVRGSSLGVGL